MPPSAAMGMVSRRRVTQSLDLTRATSLHQPSGRADRQALRPSSRPRSWRGGPESGSPLSRPSTWPGLCCHKSRITSCRASHRVRQAPRREPSDFAAASHVECRYTVAVEIPHVSRDPPARSYRRAISCDRPSYGGWHRSRTKSPAPSPRHLRCHRQAAGSPRLRPGIVPVARPASCARRRSDRAKDRSRSTPTRRCATRHDQIGEGPVAASNIRPSHTGRNLQPVEKGFPDHSAPAAHDLFIGFAVGE